MITFVRMKAIRRDPGADVLLDLDGQVFVVDAHGKYWVKFAVQRVSPTAERPHGLSYSLTLHGVDGARLVGFDNAHSVRATRGPGGKRSGAHDHRHLGGHTRPHRFTDAPALLKDSWAEVDRILRERGVL